MPQTYPEGPRITVTATLKQPVTIARRLSDLTYQRMWADRIFAKGSPEQVAGGAARFQKSESIFPDRDPQEQSPRAERPRASMDTNLHEALVKEYGLEVPINDLAVRRNQIDLIPRGTQKIANAIVRYVDAVAVNAFLADGDVPTTSGSDWGTAGRVFTDLAGAKKAMRETGEGYEADTLILHEEQALNLMTDEKFQAAMPREASVNPAMTGEIAPFYGLRNIVVVSTSALAGKAILCQSGIVGTIADEAVDPSEGWSTHQPEVGAPIHAKVYREEKGSDQIIAGARWAACWIAEPKAAFILTGI